MHDLFFVVGPTAVGKSRLAVDVAEQLGCEILNADAFQIYRGLDILTGKPDAELRQGAPHHLLSVVPVSEEMSAARFRAMALNALGGIHSRGKVALVVGGSGLYVRALTHGFDRGGPRDATRRAERANLPLDELRRQLRELDGDLAGRTDLKNRRRLMRAIEIAECATGTSGSSPNEADESGGETVTAPPGDLSTSLPLGRARGIFLLRDRDDLYARINERVHAMFQAGVEKEVAALGEAGRTAAQALGFGEIRQLLAGAISREHCIGQIQQATRHYAKRQLTWFRHQTNFQQLNLTALSHQEAVSAIIRAIARE